MPLDQNQHQIVTRLGASAFQCVPASFLCPKLDNFANIPAKIKMSFVGKDDFFFTKIDIFCKPNEGPLPSVVQAYKQPYSFGERI